MDFLFAGAAGSIATGAYTAISMPAMGHVDIPAMPNVDMPQMPSLTGPPLPTGISQGPTGAITSVPGAFIPIGPQFGSGVGQIVNGATGFNYTGSAGAWGANTMVGPTGGYPFAPQFPGYGPQGQIGMNPFYGIPGPYPNPPTFPGYTMNNNQGGFYGPNPFMSAQMVGGYNSFFGGMGNAFFFFC